jgi:hypothetical protein
MDTILNFLADNYKWFMGGAIVLLIALIGFVVDGKKKKNKNEELPESTATINQVDAVNQSQNVVPTQEVEQSLVFEQPSLNDNDTMSELKESGIEPSLTFENNNVEPETPTDYGNAEQAVNETISNNNVIGDAVATPDMIYNPVEQPPGAVAQRRLPAARDRLDDARGPRGRGGFVLPRRQTAACGPGHRGKLRRAAPL